MKSLKILLLLWLSLQWATLQGLAQTYSLQPDFIQTDGDINAITSANGRLYIGGNFSSVGYLTGPGTVIGLQSGEPDLPFPKIGGGQVYVVVPDDKGGWYIGGDFDRVAGQPRQGIARIKPDKTLDMVWEPIGSPGALINAIAVDNGRVFIGGAFSVMGGQSRLNLAAVNDVNGMALPFNPAPNGIIETMTIHNGTLYVGGSFTNMSGLGRGRAAAFNLGDLQLANWDPQFDKTVRTFFIHQSSNSIFVGGDFNTCKAVRRDFIAQLDFQANLIAWNPSANAPVRTIVGQGSAEDLRLYVGGDFTYIGGRFRNRLAEMRPAVDTFATVNWQTGADDAVNTLMLHEGILYVGGNFTTILDGNSGNGVIRNFIAQVEASTGAVSSWDPNANNNVLCMARSGNRLFVGGSFSTIGRKNRYSLFSVDESTGMITGWSPRVLGEVRTIAVQDNIAYIGGNFREIGNDVRRFIAAINVFSNDPTSWNPNPDSVVNAIIIRNNLCYVGGHFSRIGGADRSRLAALSLTTGRATDFDPNPNGRVYALANDATRLFVGGDFTTIGRIQNQNQEQKNIGVVFFNNAQPDTNWITNADEPVHAIAVDLTRDRVYIGGKFQFIQDINNVTYTRPYFAALARKNGVPLSNWNPTVYPNSDVYAIHVPANSKSFFVGGRFTNLTPGGRIVQFLADTAVTTTWKPGMTGGQVRTIHSAGKNLYVGGDFDNLADDEFVRRVRALAKYSSCDVSLEILTTATEICPGQSAQLTAKPGGTFQFFYRWSPAEGLNSTISKEVIASPSRTTTYTLQVTDGENCTAVERITITVQPNPKPFAGNNFTTCRGNNPKRQLTASGGTHYIWQPASLLDDSTSATPTIQNIQQTTTFTLTAISGPGCTDFAFVTVTVIDEPRISMPDSGFVCIGTTDSLQLDPTILSSNGGQFVWSPAAGLSNPRIRNPKVFPSNTTTYTLEYTSNESCVTSKSIVVQLVDATTVACGSDLTICKGDTARVTISSNTNLFIWEPNAFISDTRTKTPKFFPPVTTTYTCMAVGKGCEAFDTITITVNQGADLDAGPDQLLCTGQVVQLQARGNGTNYQWTPATGLSATDIPNPIANPTSTTVYTVSAIGPDGCKSTDDVMVIVRQAPTLRVRDQIVYSCSGDSAIMAVSGAFTYSWLPLEGISQPNSTVPKAAPAVTTTYTVTGRDQFGCEATAEVVVVVAEKPVADAGPDLTVCRGNQVTLSGSGGMTYKWEASTGDISPEESTAQNPVVRPVVTTVYTLTVTNEVGCVSKDVVRVTVVRSPEIITSNDTAVCFGFGSFAQLSARGGVGYAWQPATGLNDPNIPNPIARPEVTTTYTVQVTGENGCIAVDSVKVMVMPTPFADAGPNVLACPNQPVFLRASGGVTYEWTPAELLDNPTSPTPRATVSRRTVFTVTVTNEFGCKAQDETIVTLDTVFRVTANAANPTICKGDATTLQATPGAISYRWEPTAGLSNPLIANPTAAPLQTITYTVRVIGANGCSNSASVRVVVNDLPIATAGNDTFVCKNGLVQLRATGGRGYNWSPGEGLSNPNIANPVASPTQTTSYTVTITGENGCSIKDTIKVSVIEIPPVTIFPTEDPVTIFCDSDGSVQLRTTANPNYRYQWKKDGNNILNAFASAYTATEGGLYTVEVFLNGCSRSSDARRVVVQPRPNANAGPDVAICSNGNGAQLNATGGVTYQWSPVMGLSNPNIANPIANPARTTTYTVRVTDANNCSNVDEVTVTVNTPIQLTASANGPTKLCDGQSVELIATTAPGFSYQWKRDGQNITDGKAPRLIASQSGSYTVEVTIPGCPKQTSTPIVVQVNERPEVDAGENVAICTNGRAVLTATGAARYQWSPTTSLTNPTEATVVARPKATTVYTVMGISEAGCVDFDTVIVEVLGTESLPPAVISPTGIVRVCPNEPVVLTANINLLPGMTPRFQWYYNERKIQGATEKTYTATREGKYQVETLSDVCASSMSEVRQIIYREAPRLVLSRRNLSCDTCRDGEIRVRAFGGNPPYAFAKNDEQFFDNINSFTNLPKGRYKITVRDSAGCMTSDSIRLESPTSVFTMDAVQSIQVYPNPSKGIFSLQAELSQPTAITLQVYDLTGKVVRQTEIPAGTTKAETTIDLSEHTSGIYFLKVTAGSAVMTQKLIKE
jgi:hypothetical protein